MKKKNTTTQLAINRTKINKDSFIIDVYNPENGIIILNLYIRFPMLAEHEAGEQEKKLLHAIENSLGIKNNG